VRAISTKSFQDATGRPHCEFEFKWLREGNNHRKLCGAGAREVEARADAAVIRAAVAGDCFAIGDMHAACTPPNNRSHQIASAWTARRVDTSARQATACVLLAFSACAERIDQSMRGPAIAGPCGAWLPS